MRWPGGSLNGGGLKGREVLPAISSCLTVDLLPISSYIFAAAGSHFCCAGRGGLGGYSGCD